MVDGACDCNHYFSLGFAYFAFNLRHKAVRADAKLDARGMGRGIREENTVLYDCDAERFCGVQPDNRFGAYRGGRRWRRGTLYNRCRGEGRFGRVHGAA